MEKIKTYKGVIWLIVIFTILMVFLGCIPVKKYDGITDEDIDYARNQVYKLIEVYLANMDINSIVNMYPPDSRVDMRAQVESYFNRWISSVMISSNANKKPTILWLKITSLDRYAVSEKEDPTAKFKVIFKVRYEGLYMFWVPKEERYVKYKCNHSAWVEFIKYKGEVYLFKFQGLDTPACEKVGD